MIRRTPQPPAIRVNGHTQAPIHYTLGVLESGLTNSRARGANVSIVNIMNHGLRAPGLGHAAAASAADGARSQMNSLGFTSEQLRITPMIGQSDSGGEVFAVANAQSLRNNAAGASVLSFWSMGPDDGGGCRGRRRPRHDVDFIAEARRLRARLWLLPQGYTPNRNEAGRGGSISPTPLDGAGGRQPDWSMPGSDDTVGADGMWERLPVALYRTTPDGRVLDVNRAFIECFNGPTRESVLCTRAQDLYVDPADRVRWAALVQSQGVARDFETEMRRLDGTTFWARETVRAQRTPGGDVILYEGLIEDFTERRRAGQLLRDSELRYRRLFEAAKDGILILEAETAEIVDVNPFLCDLLGLSREEVLGRKLWEIGPFKDVRESKLNFRELQLREYVRYDDLPLETSNGVKVAVEFVSNVYPVDGGRVIQCNVRDITERKKSAEEHARLIRAVQQAAESIVMTDPQGTIVYVNPAFERVSGWNREEAVGRNPRILKSGKQDDAFYRQMWEALADGEVWTGRLVNRRKDGTLFEEEGTISPVRDAAGRVVNYVAVKRDITEEMRLTQQLVQAQKMEAVGRLAAGVAHDFNNLLGVITGYGDIVHRRLAGDDPLRGKVEQILKAAAGAAALTRQLLAFGRMQVLQPRIVDVNAIVSDMEKILGQIVGEDVELTALLDPNLGSVRADPGQIEQSLVNLAFNARDAMPEGGRITIETRNADLDGEYAVAHVPTRPGPYVMLAVTDTGSGMDAATQARIFEPFFTTKELGRGTGLGLSTVYGIVKQSDGYIWVYSEVGVGTSGIL